MDFDSLEAEQAHSLIVAMLRYLDDCIARAENGRTSDGKPVDSLLMQRAHLLRAELAISAFRTTGSRKEAALKLIAEVDAFATLVLRAHLVVEAQLDRLLEACSIDLGRRAPFSRKVHVARRFRLRGFTADDRDWLVIEALGELRNNIGHSFDPKDREGAVLAFREIVSADSDADAVRQAMVEAHETLFGLTVAARWQEVWLDLNDQIMALPGMDEEV